MLSKKVEKALNDQIKKEAESSQFYLAMAIWAEVNGFPGTSDFLYLHSDEERMHMMKMVKFVNERGGVAVVPALIAPKTDYKGLPHIFESLLDHEVKITSSIHEIVDICLKEKDYTTHNFMQWFVSEQLEEEALARTIIDKLKLIGSDKGGLYLFDRDIVAIRGASTSTAQN